MNSGMNSSKLLIYTRKPYKEYTESLSNSIHFAYANEAGEFTPLNQNYGILFAAATIDKQNVICEKGLKNPYLFRTKNGAFGIVAVRVDGRGEVDPESKGHIILWLSEDLITFRNYGLVKLHEDSFVKEAACEFNTKEDVYEFIWKDEEGNSFRNTLADITKTGDISLPVKVKKTEKSQCTVNLPDIIPGNIISIDKEAAEKLLDHWLPIYNTQIKVPDYLMVNSPQELQSIKATAVYSDGSTYEKKIKWDLTEIDFQKPGEYQVKGRVVQEEFPFPLACGYADPVILPWNNKYYYLATNDNVDDIGMYVREGNTKEELFAPGFKESIILNIDEDRDFIQTFWAPEFHVIGKELYIIFAVGGKVWGPQCHMMRLKKGGNIMNAGDWEAPVRVRRADGAFLSEDGITLDMTYFRADNTSCVVWSYRKNIGTALDSGSMLYIASVDENNPTVLTSDPVLLTRPLYGWENIQGTINNEGPYPLVTKDKVYITYSGGAAGGYTYAIGLLSISSGSNFLDAAAWEKASTPVLSYYSVKDVYGPGHNSFFTDYDGSVMIMYHGEVKIAAQDTRCTGMHRVHFNKDHAPVFNLSKERDLNSELADITRIVVIK